MQRESRKEEQPAEPRKDVKERPRRFRIVKLEERIAPGVHPDTGRHTYGCPGHHHSDFTCGKVC
jgi:hypothetical protein